VEESLLSAVQTHAGEFLCEQIHEVAITKVVRFHHLTSPPSGHSVPDVPGLKEFYSTFGSLELYCDGESGESAYYIGTEAQWSELAKDFQSWLEGMNEDELAECVPLWTNDCIVVGEVPSSGNYLLIPTSGTDAGKVFEFEHDGFEFIELGSSLPSFVLRTLSPDARQLTGMATHLRFVTGDPRVQWWIREMRDNRGHVVATKV
jgi:hypothetical protein